MGRGKQGRERTGFTGRGQQGRCAAAWVRDIRRGGPILFSKSCKTPTACSVMQGLGQVSAREGRGRVELTEMLQMVWQGPCQ